MGTPDKSTDTELTIQAVESVVSQAIVEQDGKKTIDYTKVPENILSVPGAKVALETELRRRNSQAEYTKSRQQLAELAAKVEVYQQKLPEVGQTELPTELIERQEALEDLKYEDIDAWYEEKRRLEQDIEAYKKETYSQLYEEASNTAAKASILAQREDVLNAFNAANPNQPLSIEMLDQYTPPAIMQKLQNNEISFEDAVKLAHSVIYGNGATYNPEEPDSKSLGDVGTSYETVSTSIDDTAIY